MHKVVLAALLALATVNVNAQHHGNAVVSSQPQSEEKPATFLRSHSKQIGTIGGRYQVHSIRIRGLDSPNLTSAVIFDEETQQLLVVGTTGAPGLGGALIGAAGEVGSSFVFGRAIRPDQTNVNNNSSGGVTTSEANAEGGTVSTTSTQNTTTPAPQGPKNPKPGKGPKNPKPGKGPKH